MMVCAWLSVSTTALCDAAFNKICVHAELIILKERHASHR